MYCSGEDMLGKCNAGGSALERLGAVVGWSISTTRPLIFGAFPYNPILGETHHVSRGTLNVLLEQVRTPPFVHSHTILINFAIHIYTFTNIRANNDTIYLYMFDCFATN